MPAYINSIKTFTPPFSAPQTESINWLQWAIAQSAASDAERASAVSFLDRLQENTSIRSRASVLEDFLEKRLDALTLFADRGGGLGSPSVERRMERHDREAREILHDLFPDERAPEAIFHVTCTGYTSPGPAQRLLNARGWRNTRHYQVGHMGCYAAFPALRLAEAHVLSGASRSADIAHVELCTLHFRPTDTRREQLVVQTLFADGAARLHCSDAAGKGASLRILAHEEHLLENSEEDMTWDISAEGFFMTLSRAVPVRIRSAVGSAVQDFLAAQGRILSDISHFAVHPGGPRIIETVQEILELPDAGVEHSRAVLAARGNMSSATVPHIWQRILEDDRVDGGSLVLSMAFGPGLTLVMNLMELERNA